jgi:hypothetical protein
MQANRSDERRTRHSQRAGKSSAPAPQARGAGPRCIPAEVEPTQLIGVRVEPAHDEAYTAITKRQWDFPAILAAYDAVACSPEATARRDAQLSCREVYLAEPDEIGDDDLICDIAFPLGDANS